MERHLRIGEGEAELVRVAGSINAEPILAALRANGIPARIVGEALGSVYGLTLDGLGEVAIVVARENLEAARELLEAGAIGALDAGDGEEPQP